MTRRIAQPIPQLDRVSDLITAARADSARGRRKRAEAALRAAQLIALTIAHVARLEEAGLLS
jgi:hypothetical protein